MRIAHARREEMQEIDKAHGGAGPVLFKSLWEKKDFQTDWWFVHSAYLLPGSGIGHHRHDRCEEIFVTIDNAAQFTHNGRTTQVEGGAAVPVRTGESHAIYNHTQQETRWFNFNVTLPGCPADATDFGDNRVHAPLNRLTGCPSAASTAVCSSTLPYMGARGRWAGASSGGRRISAPAWPSCPTSWRPRAPRWATTATKAWRSAM